MSARVHSSALVPEGQVFVMVDYGHPETPIADFGGLDGRPAEVPDGRVVMCHPADEGRLRDLLAIAQENQR